MRRIALSLLLATNLAAHGRTQSRPAAPAQIIDFGGNILTGVGLNGPHPQRVSALAIRDGIILAAGGDARIVSKWKGPGTRLVDLHGAFVIPGLNDAHVHLEEAGRQMLAAGQRLTIDQALYAYTQGPAYAEFSETWKGVLAPGYVADFDVLDLDLTKIPPRAILGAQVLETAVAGQPAPCQARSARKIRP